MGRRSKRENEFVDKIQLFIVLIILVAFVGAYFGISNDTILWINELIISFMIGFILSFIAGTLVEAFTGNFLKKIFLNIPIYKDISFSISAFAIVTFIVKVGFFGL